MSAISFVGAIVVIVTAYHGINNHIDDRIENKINDEKFLKKLSRSIRPSMVFDQNGRYLADMGAEEYIESIYVVVGEYASQIKITLSSKVYLDIAPILVPLDGHFEINEVRGKKYDWEYELKHVDRVLLEPSVQITNHRFRIEIIR